MYEKQTIYITKLENQMICVIGFDFHNSDLPLKMEFPILIYNLIQECISSGLVGDTVINAGDTVSVNGKLNVALPTVTKPDGTTQEIGDYRMNYTDTYQLGVYHMEQRQGSETIKGAFAVNFPAAESVITQAPSAMAQEDFEGVRTTVNGMMDLRNIVILIALALLGVEWIAYIRR